MLTWIIAPAVVAAAILVIIAAALISRRRRSDPLRRRLGPEYGRTVREPQGDSQRAGAGLVQREKRVEAFPPRPLSPVDRQAFAVEWAAVQRRFADDPAAALGTADRLVSRVMTDRGYPMTNFEQRAADLSVSYPVLVENYRAAHEIVTRHQDGDADGGATTEELQQAMTSFRSLFDELLGPPPAPSKVQPINRRRKVGHERAS